MGVAYSLYDLLPYFKRVELNIDAGDIGQVQKLCQNIARELLNVGLPIDEETAKEIAIVQKFVKATNIPADIIAKCLVANYNRFYGLKMMGVAY